MYVKFVKLSKKILEPITKYSFHLIKENLINIRIFRKFHNETLPHRKTATQALYQQTV